MWLSEGNCAAPLPLEAQTSELAACWEKRERRVENALCKKLHALASAASRRQGDAAPGKTLLGTRCYGCAPPGRWPGRAGGPLVPPLPN